MTIDLSTLEAGETYVYEMANGGKGEFKDFVKNYDGYVEISFGGSLMKSSVRYRQNGTLPFSDNNPFDIVALHKKPKPVEIVRSFWVSKMVDTYSAIAPFREDCVHYRITFLPETGELKYEVIKP